jgi:hypothetical protein
MIVSAAMKCVFLIGALLVPSIAYGQVDLGFEVGQKGKLLTNFNWTVMQVIDEDNMLVGLPAGQRLWVKGFKTEGLTDGKPFRISNIVKVTGTTTYKTAIGGTKTVFVIEPETTKERQEREAKEQAVKRDRQRQQAEAEADEAEWANAAKAKRDAEKKEQDKINREKQAYSKLEMAKTLIKEGKPTGKTWLKQVIDRYPETEAAKKAKKLLDEMAKKE